MAVEGAFLGPLGLLLSLLLLNKLAEQVREPTEEFRGFLEAFRSFINCTATVKEFAMCNDLICVPAWTQVCYVSTT